MADTLTAPETISVEVPVEPHICVVREMAPYRARSGDAFRYQICCTVCAYASFSTAEELAYQHADFHYDDMAALAESAARARK